MLRPADDRRLDLAHARPFTLGTLRVEPARRIISDGHDDEFVEPRVLQLLVALHAANGKVLSRNDLVEQCWGGVIVGENAVQRAVSQARKIAATIGGGSFEIETVRGVGYRLVEDSGAKGELRQPAGTVAGGPRWLTRRRVVAAAGVAGIAAATAAPVLVTKLRGTGEIDLADEFYHRGQIQLREEDDLSATDAEKSFRNALRLSPRFAEAWSGLALSYWQQLFDYAEEQLDRRAALTISAARRALALDPHIAAASAILLVIEPCFQNWDRLKPPLERLASKRPGSWFVERMLGWLAADTGNQAEAIDRFNKALKAESLLPRVRIQLAHALWANGRLTEAEQALRDAQQFWPKNYLVWEYLFEFLAFSGDTSAAARLLSDESRTPVFISDSAIPRRLKLIRAIDGGSASEAAGATDAYLALTRANFAWAPTTAMLMASIGAHGQLFELLDGYFLGHGRYATRIGQYSRRPTDFLFLPPLRPLHTDARFGALLKTIGLA